MKKQLPADTLEYELHQRVPESALALARNATRNPYSGNDPGENLSIDPGLRLLDREIPEHRTYQAEAFHRLYREQAENRRKKIATLYTELGRPDNLIVMMFCRNYLRMFDNWLASCSTNGIDPLRQLIVFCLDGEAYRHASDLGVKAFYFDPDLYSAAGRSERFGDEWFRNTILYKHAVITDALALGATVLFQDTDLVWLRDPFGYLDKNRKYYDIQIMYDGPNPSGSPVYGNTGFICVQPNPVTRSIFETGLRNSAAILEDGCEQFVFMKILGFFLQHQLLRLHILPEHMFLNGHLFNLVDGVLPPATNWKNTGIVIHYSWTKDRKEKTRKLSDFGIDYLVARETEKDQSKAPPEQAMTTRETGAGAVDEAHYTVTLHLNDGEQITLNCEKTSQVLQAVLKSFFRHKENNNDPDVIHLQLMENDECHDIFLRPSQISRIEVTPPLDQETLAGCAG